MLAELEPLEACQRLVEALGERAKNITPESAAQQLRGWSFFDMNGAVVMQRGPEMHVAADVNSRGQWFRRGDYRALMNRVLATFGKVTTSVMQGHEAGMLLVRRMGFREVGQMGGKVLFEATELRHV